MATAGEDGACLPRKVWVVVSFLELAVILILATWLSYLATHQKQGQEEVERWTTDAHLATVDNMNRTLQMIMENWQACQNHTKTLEQNLTSQAVEATQREMKKCQADTVKLQQKLSSKTQDLEDAQRQNQQQREECDARIQEVQAQYNRISTSTCSGAWVLGGPITAFLALTVPGVLLFLLQ